MGLLDTILSNVNKREVTPPSIYSGEIYHYTSLNNLGSILQNKNDAFVLWASRYDCLNDRSEGTVAENLYYDECETLKNEGQISEELYRVLSEIKTTDRCTFMIYQEEKETPIRDEYDTYVLSFSKGNDLLAMWNYYSKGSMYEAFNIGLSSNEVIEYLKSTFVDGKVLINIYSVVYDEDIQRQQIRDLIFRLKGKYESNNRFFIKTIAMMQLESFKMLYKSEHFQHEQEVRIIIKIAKQYKDEFPVKYRNASGYIVPYIELPIDKKALKHMTLGPLQGDDLQKEQQKQVAEEMLSAYQYNNAEVRYSDIPVRY